MRRTGTRQPHLRASVPWEGNTPQQTRTLGPAQAQRNKRATLACGFQPEAVVREVWGLYSALKIYRQKNQSIFSTSDNTHTQRHEEGFFKKIKEKCGRRATLAIRVNCAPEPRKKRRCRRRNYTDVSSRLICNEQLPLSLC
jgi:hypothetical protein